jgi:hypothetical protein
MECARICCEFEWVQSKGTMVWLGQSKDFVALLLGVAAAWVHVVMQVHFLVWWIQYVQAFGC